MREFSLRLLTSDVRVMSLLFRAFSSFGLHCPPTYCCQPVPDFCLHRRALFLSVCPSVCLVCLCLSAEF